MTNHIKIIMLLKVHNSPLVKLNKSQFIVHYEDRMYGFLAKNLT